MTDEPSGPERAAEREDTRARLAEAEEALRVIRTGEVDAVVVAGERGDQVYTLSGADRVYRQLIETMSEGAVTLSADGVILYGNVRSAEMLGRPLDQVLGTALRNYLPPADQQALEAVLAQARTVPSRREISLKTSEGRLAPVYLSASRVQSEEAELVFCLVLTDLTEQKRHEQIVAAERLARLILEQAAGAIVVCDEQGRIIRANQAAQRFCDGNPLLRPFAEVFPLRTDAAEPFHLAPVLRGETLRNVGVSLDRHGQALDLILTAGPLLSGQQRLGCVVTLTDITERKRLEQERIALDAQLRQQQKLEAIGTLAGGVAHEINNPINGILNYAQLIADKVEPKSQAAEYAGEIVHETKRVATIVRNLLQFARQEEQAHSPTRLADIVERILSLCRTVLRHDQITLTVDVPEDLPPVKCRSQQLQQVLMNLLTNARDALNAKYPGHHEAKTITVTVQPFEQDGRRWQRLTVADQGTGIPAEIQTRIFDPFFSTKPRDKGTGLGLSISHGIVQDHHGVLHFETEVGVGTQFHLDLPGEEE